MKSLQARLVKDDKIIGKLLIDPSPLTAVYHIPAYDSLEPLAPFKDKDGGDLYAGDNVSVMNVINNQIFGVVTQTEFGNWVVTDKDGTPWGTFDRVIKLGTIHD